MNSMTGYGRGERLQLGKKLTVELRSVNHRFLDLSIKIPRHFLFAEDFIRKTLGKHFLRGHIDVYLNFEDTMAESASLSLNLPVVNAYMNMAKELSSQYGVEQDLTAYSILKLPDAVSRVSPTFDEAELLSLVENALADAICGLEEARKVEGVQLFTDIDNKISAIEVLVGKADEIAPQVVVDYRERLAKRMKEALGDVAYDEARFLNEIAFFTDKACIDEELTRMKSHISTARKTIKMAGSIGKNLDCIVQEMNREANTMGSKANCSSLQNVVIALKTEIEKVREQVQNIE